jgi:hypothetical protein
MYDNPDINNSSIQVKKSLRKTIEKLKRSINLIELIDDSQGIDQNIIATLTENSQLLLDYLQENKLSQTDRVDEDQSETEKRENRQKISSQNINYDAKYSKKSSYFSGQKQQSNNNLIFIITIAFIVSLCFNIYSFFWKPNNLIPVNLKNNQEEQLIKTIETEIPENKTERFDLDQALQESEEIEKRIIEPDNLPTIEIEKKPRISPDSQSKIVIPEPEIIPESEDVEYEVKEELPASIANKFFQIANDYGEDLIYLIIPNYNNNSMTIVINQNWQEIDKQKQEELSDKLFKKSQSIDFYRFQIKDRQGNLLARNPAIGDRIILIK